MLFSSKTILQNCLLLLKWAILAYFGLRGNIDFPDYLQNKFYNINYRTPVPTYTFLLLYSEARSKKYLATPKDQRILPKLTRCQTASGILGSANPSPAGYRKLFWKFPLGTNDTRNILAKFD